MSSRVPQTIRPSMGRGPRLGVCLLVFLASGVIAYSLGQRSFNGSQRYMAQAGVSYKLPAVEVSFGKPVLAALPTQAEVERQILSDENLRQALQAETQSGRAVLGNEEIASLREQVRIVVQGPSVGICFSGRDATQVRWLVNQLAEQYAASERTRFDVAASQQYRESHQAAEQARHELAHLNTRLEGLLKQQADARQPKPPEPARASLPPEEPPQLRMLDNPAWLELQQQLAMLQHRRTQLLIDRTPAHPEVQYVESQIGELRKAQADVPRQIPDPSEKVIAARSEKRESGGQAPVGTLGQIVPSVPPVDGEPLDREVVALRGAVERSRDKVDRLVQGERQAWQQQQIIPQIQVDRAENCQAFDGTTGLSPRWLTIALCVGFTLALLTGILSARQRRDRPVTGLAEIQTLVPVPIVGVVSHPKAFHNNADC